MFVLEFMFGMAGVFMAFGVGLDPRQGKIYGQLPGKRIATFADHW